MWYKIASLERKDNSSWKGIVRDEAEDYALSPRVKQTIMLGARIGIANKAGEYDRESVARLSERIKAGRPVMVPHEYGNYYNWYMCIRMAGIPKSCAGEVVDLFAIPVLGDTDCVSCEPFSEEIDYIPSKRSRDGKKPYRRDFVVSK